MDSKKIQRINELAKIKKTRDLTADEKAEQQQLYKEYRAAIKQSLLNDLSNVSVKNADGTIEEVIKKDK
ncbi:DUF896 domain-containing protein [Eubacterium sp.]|uniref:DUF896 domain-containing protein n=1 Tax=Eubacterium sp. TaxID=142586 RepID=UPI0025E4C126|nr:DUF896 domain-containing protein [Eubacterium sp.]MCR5628315.1 DUF896 domain-containing protein [Eubacterium sp.]